MPRKILITPTVLLDEGELEEVFVRSPGPGGQNVNKVATAVQLRFPLERTTMFPDDVRRRLRSLAGGASGDGWLVIEANRARPGATGKTLVTACGTICSCSSAQAQADGADCWPSGGDKRSRELAAAVSGGR
jgi:hypothetical protein